jgi:hypothetical protein
VDTALLEKVQSEEVKAEMKRTKEVKEAKENEAREGVQKQIEEANLIGSEAKKRATERAKGVKTERQGVKVEARRRRRRGVEGGEEGGIGPSSTRGATEQRGCLG